MIRRHVRQRRGAVPTSSNPRRDARKQHPLTTAVQISRIWGIIGMAQVDRSAFISWRIQRGSVVILRDW